MDSQRPEPLPRSSLKAKEKAHPKNQKGIGAGHVGTREWESKMELRQKAKEFDKMS